MDQWNKHQESLFLCFACGIEDLRRHSFRMNCQSPKADSKPSGEPYQKHACGVQPCGTTLMIKRASVAGTDWSSIHHPPAQCLVELAGVVNRWPYKTWIQRGDNAWFFQTSLLSIATNWFIRTFMRGCSTMKKSESRGNAHHHGSTALRNRYCASQ